MTTYGNFRPDLAGIRAALSQPGVQAEIEQIAAEKAARAQAAGAGHLTHKGTKPRMYRSYVTHGHATGIPLGIVTTSGWVGELDESRNHTLEGLNH
ncbi:MAG: hypothetical protein ACI360_08570 [Atopobiaceae bacterium]